MLKKSSGFAIPATNSPAKLLHKL